MIQKLEKKALAILLTKTILYLVNLQTTQSNLQVLEYRPFKPSQMPRGLTNLITMTLMAMDMKALWSKEAVMK